MHAPACLPPLPSPCPAADNLVDYHIQQALRFDAEHRARLADVEAAINPVAVSAVADAPSDPVLLTIQPAERVYTEDLPQTSDVTFNRIVSVLAALCEEINFLRSVAERKYFAQLSLFGHTKNDDDEELPDGLLEAMMGRSLPLLQDCFNLANRLNAIVLNLVHQLAALYGKASV
jgi:WASH complex subunit 7